MLIRFLRQPSESRPERSCRKNSIDFLALIADKMSMERNLTTVNKILKAFRDLEANGVPATTKIDMFSEDEISQTIRFHFKMLIDNGFLREVPDQPDFDGQKCYRITWKGLAFLDLFHIFDASTNDFERTVAQIALVQFH